MAIVIVLIIIRTMGIIIIISRDEQSIASPCEVVRRQRTMGFIERYITMEIETRGGKLIGERQIIVDVQRSMQLG